MAQFTAQRQSCWFEARSRGAVGRRAVGPGIERAMTDPRRIDRVAGPSFRVRLVCVFVLVAGPVAWLFLSRLGEVSDGSAAYPSQSGHWQSSTVRVEEVFDDSGLRKGDLVSSVGGIAIASAPQRVSAFDVHGGSVRYLVKRDGRLLGVDVRLTDYPLGRAVESNIGALFLALFTSAVGAFVFWNRPHDPAARLILVLPALLVIGAAAFPFGVQVIDLMNGGLWRYVVGDVANSVFWSGLIHIALSLPEPWPARHLRRYLVAGAYALPALLYALNVAITVPGSRGSVARTERLLLISGPSARVVPLMVVGLLFISYRRTHEAEARQRLRAVYLVFGLALLTFLATGQWSVALSGATLIPLPWLALVLLPIPLAVAVAIMRYRMFDIQVIVKRSILYASVAVSLGSISLLVTVGLVSLFPRWPVLSGSGAATIAVVLFVTVGPRVRRIVGRRIYGQRDDPYEVVSILGQLESEADPGHVLSGMVGMVGTALRLPYVDLELRRADGELESAARYGRPVADPWVIPLVRGGQEIGRLLLAVRPIQEPFGPADQRLLDALSNQISNAAETVLLNAALQESREHLVVAREEERRRLRRDLHDGLGPTLAAANIQIAVLRSVLPDEVGTGVNGIEKAIREGIKDLRRIVDGLRPPALDQVGLTEAIREVARRFSQAADNGNPTGAMQVTVTSEIGDAHLAAAVEAAAYWIAIEALTNAAKHARAAHCRIRLDVVDDHLDIKIADDGVGVSHPVTEGVGMGSMRERAAEIGGRCSIRPEPGGGTVVEAAIPVRRLSTSRPASSPDPTRSPAP
jgi:two-component system NarL family sensor kinase